MIMGMTVAPSRLTATPGSRPPAVGPILPLGGRPYTQICGRLAVGSHQPILDSYASRPYPATSEKPDPARATAPLGLTGPPVRNDNRGAIRPIQPDGARLVPMILGLPARMAGRSRSLRTAGIRAAILIVRFRGRRSVARPCKGRQVDRVDRTE